MTRKKPQATRISGTVNWNYSILAINSKDCSAGNSCCHLQDWQSFWIFVIEKYIIPLFLCRSLLILRDIFTDILTFTLGYAERYQQIHMQQHVSILAAQKLPAWNAQKVALEHDSCHISPLHDILVCLNMEHRKKTYWFIIMLSAKNG